MSRKIKNIDHELCDYDEAYDRESASDIGWCGKCKFQNVHIIKIRMKRDEWVGESNETMI